MTQKKPKKLKEQKQLLPKKNELEKLRQQIGNLQKEKDELFGKLQRVSADYANFQKRTPKQITDSICYEREKIIKTLLPVLDNFEHTLQNAQSAEDVDVLFKGIQIIYDQMLDILKSHGVEQIKTLGEKFDPALHQAMMQKCEPDREENTVLEEFQKGYKLDGRVVRPTKVIVSALPSEEQPAQQEKAQSTKQKPDESKTTDTQ